MTTIHTVLGPISSEQIGRTYCHDHLLFRPPAPFDAEDPDLRLDDVEVIIQEVKNFKLAGGGCIVEMSTHEMGRSPDGMKMISEATGVHIIAATGFNKGKFCDAYVADQSIDQIAQNMINDLERGMDGTGIKAGLIKASSSLNQITPGESKIFQAAIKAHHVTGAPVSTHTEAGTMAMEQIEILTGGGVAPEHITIGHLDRKLDWDSLLAVAKTGVFMSFDQVSKEKYYPDAERIAMIKKLVETGHGNQIMLSGDIARKSYVPSYGFGYGPGFTYILWRFVPWMIESGISREAVENVLVNNPARAFSWVQ